MSEMLDWGGGHVSIAWHLPRRGAVYVALAHGAGGTMHTPSLRAFADALHERDVGVVRFNFPYVEAGKRAPGSQNIAEDCYRAVADALTQRAERVVLGGRSYGGRIASHIVAAGVRADGLLFLSYPLHPPGKPDRLRDAHLSAIEAPMLFVQGTRDPFATPDLLEQVVGRLPRATLHWLRDGDHGHKVRNRAPAEVIEEISDATLVWLRSAGLLGR